MKIKSKTKVNRDEICRVSRLENAGTYPEKMPFFLKLTYRGSTNGWAMSTCRKTYLTDI